MNTIIINREKIILEVSIDELGIIGNSLNEVCNGFKVENFDLKMGVSKEQAQSYLDHLIEIYRKAEQGESIDE